MQQTITLEAQKREVTGKKVKRLRLAGSIPATLYGHNVSAQTIAVDAKTFEKVYKQAGESTLVDLKIAEATPVKVLIQDVAKHYLTMKPIHADFYQVSMTEKLTADIPLKFVGEAPAVKELGGVLVKNLQELKVECLPQDLVHEIEIDLSALKAFGNTITVNSIKVPAGITVLNRAEEVIVLAQAPRVEEEVVAPVDEKAKIEDIKVVSEEERAKKAKEKEAEEKAGKEGKDEKKK